MSLEMVKRRLAAFEVVDFAGPASEAETADAARLFAVPLPADYLEFLRTFGAGGIESEEFVGLGGAQHLDVRRVTKRLREPSHFAEFPAYLVPVSGDGGGNYDCIDLQRSTRDVSIIVGWNHGGNPDGFPVVATGYWAWLLSIVADLEG